MGSTNNGVAIPAKNGLMTQNNNNNNASVILAAGGKTTTGGDQSDILEISRDNASNN